MLGFLLTLIVGIAAVSIFMLSNYYKEWLYTYEDLEDEKQQKVGDTIE